MNCNAADFAGHPCDSPAEFRGLVGCVHEHVRERAYCAEDAMILRLGQMFCAPCRQADGHECRIASLSVAAV